MSCCLCGEVYARKTERPAREWFAEHHHSAKAMAVKSPYGFHFCYCVTEPGLLSSLACCLDCTCSVAIVVMWLSWFPVQCDMIVLHWNCDLLVPPTPCCGYCSLSPCPFLGLFCCMYHISRLGVLGILRRCQIWLPSLLVLLVSPQCFMHSYIYSCLAVDFVSHSLMMANGPKYWKSKRIFWQQKRSHVEDVGCSIQSQ